MVACLSKPDMTLVRKSTLILVADQLRRLAYRAQFYLDVPSLVQLLKFKQLRQKFYQDLWREVATNIGAQCTDWDFGYTKISKKGSTTFVNQSNVMLDDNLTLDIMGNKALVYSLMNELGYAVPDYRLFSITDFAACENFFLAKNRPVVVKPASGTGGGRGVTTGIKSLAALRKAFRLAARFDHHLIVEEQIEGHSYRLLYINGDFIDAVRRDPPTIIGDGKHSIRQLVGMENARRLAGDPVTALSPLKMDLDCRNRLTELGLSAHHCLEAGRIIVLKKAVNENVCQENHIVRNDVHPDTILAGATLLQKVGVKFAGLDVICKDISKPLNSDNGLIGEINTTPGIHHHYLVSEKSGIAGIAEQLLDHMFRTKQGVMNLDQRFSISKLTKNSNSTKILKPLILTQVSQ
jgi:D-alanine-D-alanine ligase-like ATP-grasp enzyme